METGWKVVTANISNTNPNQGYHIFVIWASMCLVWSTHLSSTALCIHQVLLSGEIMCKQTQNSSYAETVPFCQKQCSLSKQAFK